MGTRAMVVTVVLSHSLPVIGWAGLLHPSMSGLNPPLAYELPDEPSKWEPGANTSSLFSPLTPPGTPGGATWSIMGAGFTDVSGYDPNHAGSTVAITQLGFELAEMEAMIDTALNVWADVSGFTNLGQVADGGVDAGAMQADGGHLGDIRIAAWNFTFPGNLLTYAHAFTPGTEGVDGPGATIGGDLHLNAEQIWVDDPTDSGSIFDPDADLLTVLIHEFGHSLGLDHSMVPGSIMEAGYQGGRRTLHPDDIAGIQAIYGAPQAIPEPSTKALLCLVGLGAAIFAISRGQWASRSWRGPESSPLNHPPPSQSVVS